MSDDGMTRFTREVRLYKDLLGRKYEAMPCTEVVREVLSRSRGVKVPESAIPGLDVTAPLDFLEETASLWERIGDNAGSAHEVGDVIVSTPTPGTVHLSVLVKTGAAKLALTSTRRSGVVVVRPAMIARVLGVYRARWP